MTFQSSLMIWAVRWAHDGVSSDGGGMKTSLREMVPKSSRYRAKSLEPFPFQLGTASVDGQWRSLRARFAAPRALRVVP
jgi:hypothetical protein